MKEFKDILIEKRKEFGLKQLDVAIEIGVSQSVVSQWELGKNYPTFFSLIGLADLFKCSLDEMVGRDKGVKYAI